MSRALTNCWCFFCEGTVFVPQEPPRKIQLSDVLNNEGFYKPLQGMKVQQVDCGWCGAKYLGWRATHMAHSDKTVDVGHVAQLSFRSTFDDEPGVSDLPTKRTEYPKIRAKVRRWREILTGFGTEPHAMPKPKLPHPKAVVIAEWYSDTLSWHQLFLSVPRGEDPESWKPHPNAYPGYKFVLRRALAIGYTQITAMTTGDPLDEPLVPWLQEMLDAKYEEGFKDGREERS